MKSLFQNSIFYLLWLSLWNIKISLIWIIQVWQIYKKINKQEGGKNFFTATYTIVNILRGSKKFFKVVLKHKFGILVLGFRTTLIKWFDPLQVYFSKQTSILYLQYTTHFMQYVYDTQGYLYIYKCFKNLSSYKYS